MNFDKRTIYAKLSWDNDTDKKKAFFGGAWGSMDKRDANTVAFKTGDGLVVVDVDTRNLKEIDKDIRKQLEKLGNPTVTTARGYHWYFDHKNSAEFVNKASYSKLVDVRSDGGIIFAQYKGKDERIKYERTGSIYKMPKKLHDVLKKAMSVSSKNVKKRVQWEKIPKGEIHDGMIRYIMKDFYNGLDYDEVISNGISYVQKYLGGTQREINLMMERVKWGFDKRLESKLEEQKVVKDTDDEIGANVLGDFDEDEVRGLLLKAEKVSSLELNAVMKKIKKKLGLSMAVQKDMLKEARNDTGVDEFFNGHVVWADDLGVFVEIGEDYEIYHKKNNFIQTVMSKSGYLVSTAVADMLPFIPAMKITYDPIADRGEMINKNGDKVFNVHTSVKHKGKGKKIPKTINKVLKNIFQDDDEARENFTNWLAVILQTGMRTGVAWGFFGASGTGKTLIADVMRRLIGYKNSSMNISDTQLQSQFNGYQWNKQFIHLNEVASDFHGRHGVAGKLKAMITDETVNINLKNMPEIEAENFANVILNSNKTNPIELDPDDRRWNMVQTPVALKDNKWWNSKSHFKVMSEVGEFGAYLMKREIDITLATVPMLMSDAKETIMEQTTSELELIAVAIKKGRIEKILEMLDIDDSSLDFTEEELRWAVENAKWTNELLFRIFKWGTNISNPTSHKATKYFIAPYITNERSIFKRGLKSHRGVTI